MPSASEDQPIRYHRVGDLILNSSTKRAIKVGGRAFNELVKKGVVFDPIIDPKVLANTPPDPEDIPEAIRQLDAMLPNGIQAVRGRGCQAGKIVKRAKPITGIDATRYTVKVAAQAVAANINEICEESGDDAEMIGLVEKLILAEMTQGLRNIPPKRGPGRPKKAAEEKYVEAPVPEEPSSEEEPEIKAPPAKTKKQPARQAPFRPVVAPKVPTRGGSLTDNARRAIMESEQKEITPTETEPETETAIEESEGGEGEGDDEEDEDDAWADEPENWDE